MAATLGVAPARVSMATFGAGAAMTGLPRGLLAPVAGVVPIESTIDHTGPMTATVADNALMLEVLAGPDGLDPRQYAPRCTPTPKRWAAA